MNIEPPTTSLRTPPFAHYALAWSPFHPTLIALASSANYGLIGNGRLNLARLGGPPPPTVPQSLPPSTSTGDIHLEKAYSTQDGLYDLAWSEVHENQIVTASGDGSLKLWDITLNDHPIRAWHEHAREVFGVDWSNINKELFSSCSWDGSVKIWTPERPNSIQTIPAHASCVYQALFSPHSPQTISTCSTDGTLKIFDLRQPIVPPAPQLPGVPATAKPALLIPAHGTEVLSLDWNKYRPWVLASASVDKTIKVWDCRHVASTFDGPSSAGLGAGVGREIGATCEISLLGHEYAVKKIQWSPHRADLIASASYDMTCRIWSTAPPTIQPPRSLLYIHDKHTEFVAGCAWSLYDEGVLASCGWDHSVHVFRP